MDDLVSNSHSYLTVDKRPGQRLHFTGLWATGGEYGLGTILVLVDLHAVWRPESLTIAPLIEKPGYFMMVICQCCALTAAHQPSAAGKLGLIGSEVRFRSDPGDGRGGDVGVTVRGFMLCRHWNNIAMSVQLRREAMDLILALHDRSESANNLACPAFSSPNHLRLSKASKAPPSSFVALAEAPLERTLLPP
ncbi:hypothetical protein M407DRAFT_246764, partial [Tulasnella calospora MUT 4182]